MARQPQRRQLTGCIRRGPKRQKSSYHRVMHLSHKQVGYRQKLQQRIAIVGTTARSALQTLSPLILLSFLIQNSVIYPTTTNTLATTISLLLRIQYTHYFVNKNRFTRGLRYDHLLYDIPLEEEEGAAPTRMPRQHIRFSSWTNQECYDNTSFGKAQLRRIYRLFGLAQIAAQNNGYIRVFSGHEVYRFHPEEMFLFLMTKCRTGHTNKHLCDFYFGGHQSRWSFGYPWMLRYLDERYENTIGNQGLRRYVNYFPAFYDAFNEFIRKTSTHHYNDNTAEDHIGLRFLPFDIFALIDCSIYRINRPFSGPDGDYIGAPRKADYYDSQRAVYTGYKKCHGIKVQTVMLPNGISFLYGPTSARVSDVAGVLQMSGLDQFLLQIQQGRNHIYSVFGDGVYNANGLHCVRSYFRAYGPGAVLTLDQDTCNTRMKAIREAIEWSYADIENIFQICSDDKNFRLGVRNPYAQEQLRVCHLLSNIYTCLNGCKASGHNKFNCPPPQLEWYLHLP